mmetsp:Transcript_92453/g.258404  ORF Transcript_92453/g.258404 Transcript_92453/m.258404 type:complete len:215 (-) Transcript_92453:67-711(-)
MQPASGDPGGASGQRFKARIGVSHASEWELVFFDAPPAAAGGSATSAGANLVPSAGPPPSDSAPRPPWPLDEGSGHAQAEARPVPHMTCGSSGSAASAARSDRPDQRWSAGGAAQANDAGDQTSVVLADGAGAAAHRADLCRPCIFVYHGVCEKGETCSHCHFPHSARQLRRANPSVEKRNKVRRRVAASGAGADAASTSDEPSAADAAVCGER